ncbi:MAG TPA: methyltransferase domain-containing protein [Opitutus sp.]|nr:methyltransferase domain-containing protein [Opitutus sp.]
MNSLLHSALAALPPDARILDAGGWFKPLNRATHIVDLMPYETRRGVVTPNPLAGECFTRDTWLQLNFLTPGWRLPFADQSFDFVFCGHTIEDLADPAPLLRELRRVARAGYFETPSRLCEQTVGQRDRMCSAQGHPHHHWIVEAAGPAELLLAHKADSLDGNPRSRVPLRTYERLVRAGSHSEICQLSWRGTFEFTLVRGEPARQRAAGFAGGLGVRPADHVVDRAIRIARRLKRLRQRAIATSTRDWWEEMLRISRPYSKLPLS